MRRPIGRCRRSKHRKLLTPLNMARHVISVRSLALPHYMRSRVYATVGRPPVCLFCLSVSPTVRPPRAAAAALLLSAGGQEISIDCCLAPSAPRVATHAPTDSKQVSK